MKKNICLIGLLLTITISGCGNKTSTTSSFSGTNTNSSSIDVNNSNSVESNESSSSIFEEGKAEIVIEYYFKDGTYFDRVKTKGNVGEKYTFNSPQIDFMKADNESIELTLSEDGFYQKVVYDYSNEVIEEVEHGRDFSCFMADPSRGVSINFISSNNDIYRNNIFENEYFVIMNSYFKYQDLDYFSEFKPFNAIKSNNASTQEFLVNADNEIYVSISINPDYSIDMYKNGLLMYTWVSSMRPESGNDYSKSIRDLVDNIFYGFSSSGFTISEGNFNIKNLMIDEALTIKEATKLYRDYVQTEIRYVDEFDNQIFDSKTIIDNGGTEYRYESPIKEHFTYDKAEVSGITDKDKLEKVVYTFDAEERITSSMESKKENVLDRTNTGEWKTHEWYDLALNLESDFILRTNYHLNGSASMYTTTGNDACWRTNLTIIEDASNKDRFVSRLDWFGWMDNVSGDGTHIGKNTNFGSSYVDNYNQDIYNIYSDCEITETITRDGSYISIDFIIRPNKRGYENKVYNHRVTFDLIGSPILNVKFAAEDAVITFNSIKYIEL